MSKKLLVLGATGATGRHVVAAARRSGHDVTCFVRNQNSLVELLGAAHGCRVVADTKGFENIDALKNLIPAAGSGETAFDAIVWCASLPQGSTAEPMNIKVGASLCRSTMHSAHIAQFLRQFLCTIRPGAAHPRRRSQGECTRYHAYRILVGCIFASHGGRRYWMFL